MDRLLEKGVRNFQDIIFILFWFKFATQENFFQDVANN